MTAPEKFKYVMKEYKDKALKLSSGKPVKSIKQALAIAFSEARKITPSFSKKAEGGFISARDFQKDLNSIAKEVYEKTFGKLLPKEQEKVILKALASQPIGVEDTMGIEDVAYADGGDIGVGGFNIEPHLKSEKLGKGRYKVTYRGMIFYVTDVKGEVEGTLTWHLREEKVGEEWFSKKGEDALWHTKEEAIQTIKDVVDSDLEGHYDDKYADGGEISEEKLKKRLKEDDISWSSDKEFFEIARNQGWDYDDDKEMFVSMETFNEAPYDDEREMEQSARLRELGISSDEYEYGDEYDEGDRGRDDYAKGGVLDDDVVHNDKRIEIAQKRLNERFPDARLEVFSFIEGEFVDIVYDNRAGKQIAYGISRELDKENKRLTSFHTDEGGDEYMWVNYEALIKLLDRRPKFYAEGGDLDDIDVWRKSVMSGYENSRNKDLERGGFDPDTLTEGQKNLILQPQEGPENFYMDGEISPTQAKKYWKERLKSSGLTTSQVSKAVKMNFGSYAKGGMTEHGLETGDNIVHDLSKMSISGENKVEVREWGTDKKYQVDLDKGERKPFGYAKGGKIDQSKLRNITWGDIDYKDYPDFTDAYIESAQYEDESGKVRNLTTEEIESIDDNYQGDKLDDIIQSSIMQAGGEVPDDYAMFSKGGNKAVLQLVKRIIKKIKGKTKVTQKGLNTEIKAELKKISKKYPEVWDSEPEIQIQYTINPFLKSEGYNWGTDRYEWEKGGEVDTTIAETILQQLGGMGKLRMMTGANRFGALKNGVKFRIPYPKTNVITITVNGRDYYDMEIGRLRAGKYKVVEEFKDVYYEDLVPNFERATGLYLTLEKGGEVGGHFEYVEWEDIKRDMKYPESDNNKGYIYGINLIDEESEEIMDVEWYKTPEEREESIKKNNLTEHEYRDEYKKGGKTMTKKELITEWEKEVEREKIKIEEERGKARTGNPFKEMQDGYGFTDKEVKEMWQGVKDSYKGVSIEEVIKNAQAIGNEGNDRVNLESEIVYLYPQKDLDKYEKQVGFNRIMAKGGGIKSNGDMRIYKDEIKELFVQLNGEIEKIQGKDVVSSVDIKKSALEPVKSKAKTGGEDALKKRIMEYALDYSGEYASDVKEAKKETESYAKFIKTNDLKTFKESGLTDDMIMAFYCGVRSVIDFKGDYEISALGGIFHMGEDYVEGEIKKALNNAKKKNFELGLKYPTDVDFSKFLGIPKETKTIKGKKTKFGQYTYKVWIYDKLVAGKMMGMTRDGVYASYGSKDTITGGYLGFISSDASRVFKVLKDFAKNKKGYVKDVEFLVNGLGGIYEEPLKKNKIKYADGGQPLFNQFTPVEVGDILWMDGKKGKVTNVGQHKADVEFEDDGIYSIEFSRIEGDTIGGDFVSDMAKGGSTYADGGEMERGRRRERNRKKGIREREERVERDKRGKQKSKNFNPAHDGFYDLPESDKMRLVKEWDPDHDRCVEMDEFFYADGSNYKEPNNRTLEETIEQFGLDGERFTNYVELDLPFYGNDGGDIGVHQASMTEYEYHEVYAMRKLIDFIVTGGGEVEDIIAKVWGEATPFSLHTQQEWEQLKGMERDKVWMRNGSVVRWIYGLTPEQQSDFLKWITRNYETEKFDCGGAVKADGGKITANKFKQIVKDAKDYLSTYPYIWGKGGKNYVPVEGWQYVGRLLGYSAKVVEVNSIEGQGWQAKAEIVNDKGMIVCSGFGLATKQEEKWAGEHEQPLHDFAQTKAVARAFANCIGDIMKASGYQRTPAEEMYRIKGKSSKKRPAQSTTITGIPSGSAITTKQWEKEQGEFEKEWAEKFTSPDEKKKEGKNKSKTEARIMRDIATARDSGDLLVKEMSLITDAENAGLDVAKIRDEIQLRQAELHQPFNKQPLAPKKVTKKVIAKKPKAKAKKK